MRLTTATSVALLFSVGCSSPATQPEPTPDAPTFVSAVLPNAGDLDCDPVAAPSVCEWANSVDAIVVGQIVQTAAITSPVWKYDDEPHLADNCPEDGWFVNPGVSLKLDVHQWLYGDGPEEVVALAGQGTVDEWGVLPGVEQGELVWAGNADTLAVGTTVGLALTRVPGTQQWAAMGELPFTFTADGNSVFSDDVCKPAPSPLPANFEALASALSDCSVSTNERYQERLNVYTQSPDYSHAGACHQLQ